MNTLANDGEDREKSESRRSRYLTTRISAKADPSSELVENPDLANDRYQLLAEIQRGGMGIIYRASDNQLEREVAIKILRSDYAQNARFQKAILTEACVISYLSHPGVTPIYERGACRDGRPYYVMKWVDGVTLAEMMHRPGQKISALLRILANVSRTLAFAHSRNVIHLDLKPSNVMVGEFGEVYVMDWGLAQFEDRSERDSPQADQDQAETVEPSDQHVNGTPEYMSPEQAGGRALDARADVFGLGAILCEILIGQPPYQGESVSEVYANAVEGSMHSAFKALDESDADHMLVRLAKRCLSPKRADRPPSAVEVARELATYQESALERAESDMNRFFQLSLDLFCIAGLDGYFRRVNENFARVLGHSEEELLSRPFLDFVHEADRDETVRQMSILKEGEPVVRFRNRYLTASGQYIVLEWTSKSIEKEGIIFAVARDVTSANQ